MSYNGIPSHSSSLFSYQMLDWTSEGDHQSSGAFVQWKPVCYLKHEYNTRSASKVTEYDLQNYTQISDLDAQPHLLYAFFGDRLTSGKVGVQAINVSFGLSGDKFYQNTNYTGWWVYFQLSLKYLNFTLMHLVKTGTLPHQSLVLICVRPQ